MKKKLIKLVTVLCLAALIFTTATPVRAETTMYTSTQVFMDYLDMKGVKYRYMGVDGRDETVSVIYSLDNFDSLKCNLYFQDDDEVDLRIYDIVTVSGGTDHALSVINALNSEYKFAKFVLNPDDRTIQAEQDMLIDPETCGKVVYQAMIMLFLVIDDEDVSSRLHNLEYSIGV